jgi:hypothetical protein
VGISIKLYSPCSTCTSLLQVHSALYPSSVTSPLLRTVEHHYYQVGSLKCRLLQVSSVCIVYIVLLMIDMTQGKIKQGPAGLQDRKKPHSPCAPLSKIENQNPICNSVANSPHSLTLPAQLSADPFLHTPTSTPQFLRIPFSTLATQFRLQPPSIIPCRGHAEDAQRTSKGANDRRAAHRIASRPRVYTSSALLWLAPSRLLISSLLQEQRAHDKRPTQSCSPKKHRALLGLIFPFFDYRIYFLPSFLLPFSYSIPFALV